MHPIIELILITFIPALELRASIPYGILGGTIHLPFGINLSGLGMEWYWVVLVCILANIVLGVMVYFLLDNFVHLVVKVKWIGKIYNKIVARTQHRIKKYVEKYGEFGIAVFIGIPLPGSGVYTGALAAYLIGLKFKKFILANVIGVLMAGIIVTLIIVSGSGLFGLFVK